MVKTIAAREYCNHEEFIPPYPCLGSHKDAEE